MTLLVTPSAHLVLHLVLWGGTALVGLCFKILVGEEARKRYTVPLDSSNGDGGGSERDTGIGGNGGGTKANFH